jgi:hypothetical protein
LRLVPLMAQTQFSEMSGYGTLSIMQTIFVWLQH